MKTKDQLINELLACADRMSNILYLFEQQEGCEITKQDCATFRKYRKMWDELQDKLIEVVSEETH